MILKVIEKDNLDLLCLTKAGVSVARLNTEQGRKNLVKVMPSQKRDKILSKKDKENHFCIYNTNKMYHEQVTMILFLSFG